MPEREIQFERLWNLRDLGGYVGKDGRTVRWRRLYRGMSPEWMAEADAHRARRELNIGVIVDLRGPGESPGPLGNPPVRRIPIDFWAGSRPNDVTWPPTEDDEVFFPWLMKSAAPQIVQTIEAFATADGPLLFHCSSGKDRTGMVAAAILGLLEVSDDVLIADYMMSDAHFERTMKHLHDIGRPTPARAPRHVGEAPTEPGMRAAVSRVHSEFGGFRQYLRANSASDSVLDVLTEELLG